MDIMKHIFKQKEHEILKMDCWDIQVFLGRKVYEQCIAEHCFYPPFNHKKQA